MRGSTCDGLAEAEVASTTGHASGPGRPCPHQARVPQHFCPGVWAHRVHALDQLPSGHLPPLGAAVFTRADGQRSWAREGLEGGGHGDNRGPQTRGAVGAADNRPDWGAPALHLRAAADE